MIHDEETLYASEKADARGSAAHFSPRKRVYQIEVKKMNNLQII